ncbi:MAG TPA: VOC family protein [Longimicrobium sp.]|nr:VOC family protein [Longimicrobium sp.]
MAISVDPYLNFNGNCAEAMRFYADVLGGSLEFMATFGESPMAEQTPPEQRDLVMHATIVVDGQRIMASDAPGGYYSRPQGLYVSLGIPEPDRARRVFDALSEGGSIQMPFEPTFWASGGFAMFTDRFGTPWMISSEPSQSS